MNNTGLKFYTVEKIEGGYLKRTGSRKVCDIRADLQKLLDKAKMPYEYVSDVGWSEKTWPIGKHQVDYCWLEVGGNEGWSIYVATRYTTKPADHSQPYGHWHHDEPIRIKLLCGTDDAWRVVRFVQEHLDCW